MSIGIDLDSKQKPSYNLAELMRNVRRKKKRRNLVGNNRDNVTLR